jgi:hypothetical protein
MTQRQGWRAAKAEIRGNPEEAIPLIAAEFQPSIGFCGNTSWSARRSVGGSKALHMYVSADHS